MRYDPDEPRTVARERVFGRMRQRSGDGRQSMLTVVLAVSIFVGTGALGFWQASTPGRVVDQLEVGVAELTDVDTYLAATVPGLRQTAVQGGSEAYELPGFPVSVVVSRGELLDLPDAELRDLVLQRAAVVVYVEGLEAFDRTGNQNISLLSTEWFVGTILGLLTGGWHGRAEFLAIVSYMVATLAGALIFARAGTVGGLKACGFAGLAGAVPGLVFTAAGAYWFANTGGGDPFVRSIAGIIEAFFLVPRRDYLVVTTLAAFFVALSYALPLIDRLVVRQAGGRSGGAELPGQPMEGYSEPSFADEPHDDEPGRTSASGV